MDREGVLTWPLAPAIMLRQNRSECKEIFIECDGERGQSAGAHPLKLYGGSLGRCSCHTVGERAFFNNVSVNIRS